MLVEHSNCFLVAAVVRGQFLLAKLKHIESDKKTNKQTKKTVSGICKGKEMI